MAEEPIQLILIDDLLKARRRCTTAAFPSWLGRLPALAFAVLSLVDGAFSFAIHSLVACSLGRVAWHVVCSWSGVASPLLACQPRIPVRDVPYQVVRDHHETFRAQAASIRDGEGLPRFVEEDRKSVV